MDYYLNGQLLPAADARVAATDAGLQHGVGLFETMHVQAGRAFRLDRHLQRLALSSRDLGLVRQLDTAELTRAVEATIAHNQLDRARLRLTVTAGDVSLLRPTAAPTPLTVLVTATPPTAYDPAYFERGIMALIGPPIANPFDAAASHKTLAYWPRLRLLRQAATVQAGEVLLLNLTNHLASGTISNLFLVKDGALRTPIARGEELEGALPAPVLPGITRAAVSELAEAAGLKVERRMLAVADLLDADEAFLTNSSWQVLPLTRVEKKQIADGNVGPVTRQLRTALLDLIARECA